MLTCKQCGIGLDGQREEDRNRHAGFRRLIALSESVVEMMYEGGYPAGEKIHSVDAGVFCTRDCLAKYLLSGSPAQDEKERP